MSCRFDAAERRRDGRQADVGAVRVERIGSLVDERAAGYQSSLTMTNYVDVPVLHDIG